MALKHLLSYPEPSSFLIWTRRVLLAGLAFSAVAVALAPHASSNAPPYRTAAVDKGDIAAIVNATGTINPITTIVVGSQLSGIVVEILAGYNDEVAKDQVLARLDAEQIRYKLEAAKADIVQMQASLESAKVDSAEAVLEFSRQNTLHNSGATSESAFTAARTKAEVSKVRLRVMEAQIKQKEAILRQLEVDLRNTDLRSPVDGVVVKRDVELGQTVAAAYQAPTLFTLADDLHHVEIAANIDETDVGNIKPGQKVKFTVTAYPDQEFVGIIKQVRLGPTTISNVVVYTAIVSVENPELQLLPGMTANLRIETAARLNVARIPNTALRWHPANMKADGRHVFTLDDNGNPRAAPVQTGISDGSFTELVSGPKNIVVGAGK
jgi:HlyD family secretion protein